MIGHYSKLPKEWKTANITAVYKKGDKKDPGNYRPVSLTYVIYKLMKVIIREKIINHLKENQVITRKQYGFMSGRSTVLQLITVVDRWTSILDEGGAIDVADCDSQKAFDTVAHKRLMEKIKSYNVGGNITEWISDFLSDRKQRVIVNGTSSEWTEVKSGVP